MVVCLFFMVWWSVMVRVICSCRICLMVLMGFVYLIVRWELGMWVLLG